MGRAPAHRVRVRPGPRGDRGLHARSCRAPRAAARGCKPASLAVTIGDKNLFEVGELSIRDCGRVLPDGRALRTRPADRRARVQGGARAAAVHARRRSRLPLAQPRRRARSRAARRSASGSRRRSAAASSACSTCSTSRRSACTSATTSGSSRRWCGCANLGNTVIVVEHDEETIRVADHVVDIGPGAGEHGGEIVVSGTRQGPAEVEARRSPASTSRASARSRCPELRREPGDAWIAVRGAREHNLQRHRRRVPARLLRRGHRRERQRARARSSATSCTRR